MCKSTEKYRSLISHIFIGLSLFFSVSAYSQKPPARDTIIRISPGTLLHFRDSVSFFSNDSMLRLPTGLVPSSYTIRDRNLIFFDSLKAVASKNPLTRKLYDFVIVSPQPVSDKRITGSSDALYKNFEGKRIRKIEYNKLDIFGTDINNPAVLNANKGEKLLNKTHVYTNEKIIRKNLLFSVGDIISPLMLSDNERMLRQLPFIDDARIIVVPVSDDEADIVVVTKDIYSLGASVDYHGIKKGTVSIFEKNILGIGHELGIDVPYDSRLPDSPGIGAHYNIDNIAKSFINLNLNYLRGLGEEIFGFSITRKLVSASTKYAGGISVSRRYTTDDLNNTLPVPQPIKRNLQDYWLLRSFLTDKEKVSRVIFGARFINNNVYDRPEIPPDSFYYLQKYYMYLGSVALSVQKYYKTNLIYSYGRTEDIPYGGLIRLTAGREYNEFNSFRKRTYLGSEVSLGKSSTNLGYFYASAGLATFLNGKQARQGVLTFGVKYFSNLVTLGQSKIRNFLYADYTRGFDRNTDEFVTFDSQRGLAGLKNDSIRGTERLSVSLESVVFSPVNVYGFRFAFFGFTDFSFLSKNNEIIGNGYFLTGIGVGIRIRNDNMVFNTFQIRLGFFPGYPSYSKINNFTISGEQLLMPNNFDSGPPSVIPFK